MRIAALQTDIEWENPTSNFDRAVPWIEQAAAAGAELILLPEMFACGFSMNTELTAETLDGPTTTFLRSWAQRTGAWLGGSVPIRDRSESPPNNSFLLASPEGRLVRYRKIHPFSSAGEDQHFEAGQDLVTVRIGDLSCTLFVCYDLRFANVFWQTAPKTDAYLVIANWPIARRHHWTTLLRARAIENQAFVVGVNRVGEGRGLLYGGDSQVIAPDGALLGAVAEQEAMLLADLDPARVQTARASFPFLADRVELP